MVELTRIISDETEQFRVFLKAQIERHVALTGSARAKASAGRLRRHAGQGLAGQAEAHFD